MNHTALNPDILSLEPVRAPRPVRAFDTSDPVAISRVAETAGMRNVVSGNDGTRIFLIDSDRDQVISKPGMRLLGVSKRGLPDDPCERAREILRRLAYGFHDWAAREIVGRYHRDLKREIQERAEKNRSSPAERVLKILRKENGATIGRLARATGLAQSNVTRTVRLLEKRTQIRCVQHGRNVLVYLADHLRN
jgi:DNA-binding transcriptional ArsR family regulator